MDKKLLRIKIPEGIKFADLKLARNATTGEVSFKWAPVEAICNETGLDIEIFRKGREDNIAELIVAWYAAAQEQESEVFDPVAEELITEVLAEDGAF
jgi:hypothetical protein